VGEKSKVGGKSLNPRQIITDAVGLAHANAVRIVNGIFGMKSLNVLIKARGAYPVNGISTHYAEKEVFCGR
jgi:hypothetical protein